MGDTMMTTQSCTSTPLAESGPFRIPEIPKRLPQITILDATRSKIKARIAQPLFGYGLVYTMTVVRSPSSLMNLALQVPSKTS